MPTRCAAAGLAGLGVVALAACTGGSAPPGSPSLAPPAVSSGATANPTKRSTMSASTSTGRLAIRLSAGGRTIAARLYDNPAAADFATLLPLTLPMRDYGRQEKLGELPRALRLEGVPSGADPDIDDIGYYAPDRVLVLYYTDVGYFAGIVRLGSFDSAARDVVRGLPDGTEVTIEKEG